MKRTNTLQTAAQKQGKPTNFAIFNPTNISYFCGFSAANALLIPTEGKCKLFVSSVNFEQAKAEAKDVEVQLCKRGENLMEKIAKQVPNSKISIDTLPIESWYSLAKAIGGENKLEVAGDLIKAQRSVKDQLEIDCIREACRLAMLGMQRAKEVIGVGVKEKDVAAEAEYAMRKAGSEAVAFETIVASGPIAAFPHGSSMERVIGDRDLVIVDLGATYKSYRSDITRTYIASKAIETQAAILNTIKVAQQKAIETIKPHVAAKEVDAAARGLIEQAGFGKFFIHNTGHGVGLDIHEAPTLSPDSKDTLEAGNVVTVEPGIYIPGFGGARIEDTVLVTKKGAERLTIESCKL